MSQIFLGDIVKFDDESDFERYGGHTSGIKDVIAKNADQETKNKKDDEKREVKLIEVKQVHCTVPDPSRDTCAVFRCDLKKSIDEILEKNLLVATDIVFIEP